MDAAANTIRSASQSDWWYTKVANVYERPFTLKAKADALDLKAKSEHSPLDKFSSKFKANTIRFAAMWTEHDYDRQSEVHVGRVRFKVPNPPMGALLAMLYVATIPFRAYQAYRRGKKEHDYREVGDVIRRDVISVTVFVFGLGILKKILAKRFQRHFKVNLLDKKTDNVLTYSQFSNYRINSLHTLKGILKEGNDEGLHRAINRLHDHQVAKLNGDHRLEEAIGILKAEMSDLTKLGEHAPQRNQQIETVYKAMQAAEATRIQVRAEVLQQSSKNGVKLAEQLKEPIPNALETYAKHARLPSDMISFGMVAGLLGWFPVWFNKTWNQLQYNHKTASKSSQQAYQPLSLQTVPSSSSSSPFVAST
jgi:hypothetical protein